MIEFLNQCGIIWIEYFGLAVLQNTIFLCFVFFALSLLRNAPARIKYAITMIGLIKLFFPPIIPLSFLTKLLSNSFFSNDIITNDLLIEIKPIIFIIAYCHIYDCILKICLFRCLILFASMSAHGALALRPFPDFQVNQLLLEIIDGRRLLAFGW